MAFYRVCMLIACCRNMTVAVITTLKCRCIRAVLPFVGGKSVIINLICHIAKSGWFALVWRSSIVTCNQVLVIFLRLWLVFDKSPGRCLESAITSRFYGVQQVDRIQGVAVPFLAIACTLPKCCALSLPVIGRSACDKATLYIWWTVWSYADWVDLLSNVWHA